MASSDLPQHEPSGVKVRGVICFYGIFDWGVLNKTEADKSTRKFISRVVTRVSEQEDPGKMMMFFFRAFFSQQNRKQINSRTEVQSFGSTNDAI